MNSRWAVKIGLGIVTLALFGGTLITPKAHAADSQIEVLVGDVCPNIPGNQPVIPNGMLLNEAGECYTPAPPPPPDACPNISTYQAAIPAGYYRNAAGNCVTQTTPPRDVCPNISGSQASVPDGMQTAESGHCIWPPRDVCPNIDGPQETIPKNMRIDDAGSCFTPSSPNEDSGTDGPGSSTSGDDTRNEYLSLLPYYLISTLFALAVGLVIQTLKETSAAASFLVFFRRKKHVAETKDLFVILSSHYLQQKSTAMSAQLSLEQQGAIEDNPQPLANALDVWRAQIDQFAKDSDSGAILKEAPVTILAGIETRTLGSPVFWAPIGIVGLAVIATHLYYIFIERLSPNIIDLSLQLVMFVTASLVLYFVLSWRHVRHLNLQNAKLRIENEYSLDDTRNDTLSQTIEILQSGLRAIDTHRIALGGTITDETFNLHVKDASRALSRLELLSKIRLGSKTSVKFALRDAINNCLIKQRDNLDEKKLSITDAADNYPLELDRSLLEFALCSVLESAVYFSTVGGNITIITETQSHKLKLQVSDDSTGMPQEKLDDMFKPTPQMDLETESAGLNLSLFLCAIIMDYLGGAITANTVIGKGTTVTLETPIA